MTVQLYTLVNFTCEGTGVILKWSVEDASLNDPSNQDREISVTTNNISVDVWSSVLTIRALPINNGISIGCVVLGQNFSIISKGATLTVKGISSLYNHNLLSFHYSTGITPVENIQFTFDVTSSSSWLTWSHPFKNYPLSYHIYIENQHGQLLYNDITEDTSYELYNLTVCDIYTATVNAHSGEYTSNNVIAQDEFSGGMTTI